MSVEENKAVVRRFIEEVNNQQKIDVYDEIVAPEWTFQRHLERKVESSAWLRENILKGYKAAPDLHIDITLMVAEGEYVVIFDTYTFTFVNDLEGTAATGKHGSFSAVEAFRIKDSKIVELRREWDTAQRQKLMGTYG
jgi:predicted ester cyclase